MLPLNEPSRFCRGSDCASQRAGGVRFVPVFDKDGLIAGVEEPLRRILSSYCEVDPMDADWARCTVVDGLLGQKDWDAETGGGHGATVWRQTVSVCARGQMG